MPFMPWTPEDVRGLVELADTRGVGRRELAEEFIGCSESLLSYYLNGKKEPSDLARAAMERAEFRLKRRKPKEGTK